MKSIKTPILKKNKIFKHNKEHFDLLILHQHTKSICKLEMQTEKNQEKKKKKSTWIFLLCNILIVGAIIIYTLNTQETKPIGELIAEKPYFRYLFIGLLMMLLFYLIRGIAYAHLLKKTSGKFNLWLGIKVSIVGKYWDSITPGGSGGQFAQVGYLNGKGQKGDVSTSVIVGGYMLWQIAFVIVGVLVITIPFDLYTGGKVIKYFALAGVLGNVFLFAVLMLISLNKKVCSVIVVGGLKLLTKMKIIKNYRKALYKSLLFVRQYQQSIRAVAKSPWTVIFQVLTNLLSLIVVASVDYFIYKTFNPFGTVSPVQIIAMSFLCTFATTLFIVPGGSGAAEISYVAMFTNLFTEGTTFWALMFWRILTYYLYIIVGFLLTIIEPMIARKKVRIETMNIVNDKKHILIDNKENCNE